jgi:hypothetical protein
MTLDACDRIRKPPAQGKPPAQVLGDDLRASIDITGTPLRFHRLPTRRSHMCDCSFVSFLETR